MSGSANNIPSGDLRSHLNEIKAKKMMQKNNNNKIVSIESSSRKDHKCWCPASRSSENIVVKLFKHNTNNTSPPKNNIFERLGPLHTSTPERNKSNVRRTDKRRVKRQQQREDRNKIEMETIPKTVCLSSSCDTFYTALEHSFPSTVDSPKSQLNTNHRPVIEVILVADSHCLPEHFFSLQDHLNQKKTPLIKLADSKKLIVKRGGKIVEMEEIILSSLRSSDCSNYRLWVIALMSNDIRRYIYREKKPVEFVISPIIKILNEVSKTGDGNTKLLFISPLPSVCPHPIKSCSPFTYPCDHEKELELIYKQVNSLMEEKISKFSNIARLMTLSDNFKSQDSGYVDRNLFVPRTIHLNTTGGFKYSKIIADSVINCCLGSDRNSGSGSGYRNSGVFF